MKKKILSLIMVGAMVLSFAACGEKKEAASEKFTVGFDQEFPPMGFVGDDGEVTGFDIDLAKEAAKRMNKEIVLKPIDWASKDMELDSGNIDCIWNGFTMTGREDKYTWTDPYLENEQVVVVKGGSDVKTLADLAGKVVEVQADSSAQAALKEKPELVDTFKELRTTADYLTAMMDLESGAVSAIAMDSVVADYQITKGGKDFAILDESISSEEYGIGFKLGNETLRDEVQKVLKEMKKDGTMEKISTEWFGSDITTLK